MAVDATLVRNVVVLVPGIMGSELVDGDGRPVWSLEGRSVAHAIRTLGRSLRKLRLPDGIGDAHPGDGVVPTQLVGGLHVIPGLWSPVDGYRNLHRFLESERFHLQAADPSEPDIVPNLIGFAYDWRLSNRYNGRLLAETATRALERWRAQPGMGDAKLVLVCHSMGGLVARWFAEQHDPDHLIDTIVTIGTPYRGSVKAFEKLVNGLDPGIGPLHLDLTSFVRSLPSMYQLLPTYDCLVGVGGRRSLLAAGSPGLERLRVEDAVQFHRTIAGRDPSRYRLHKVIGIRQPTATTATMCDGLVRLHTEIDDHDQGGDGTVARLAAEPEVGRGDEVHEIAEQHGSLPVNSSLLDLLDGLLSRDEIIWQGDEGAPFGVSMAELLIEGDEPVVTVTDQGDRRIVVHLTDEGGRPVGGPVAVYGGRAELGLLGEGGYRATVSASDGSTVVAPFVVYRPEVDG